MATIPVTISVENLAPENGTFLTPLWFGFHDGTFDTYDRGRPSSPGLERLAEDGTTDVISEEFDLAGFGTVQGAIVGTEDTPGPIDPGEIATFNVEIDGEDPGSAFFNYASMIIPSNDFFIANGNERAHPIFDGEGNFVGADFIITGNNALDAGTEVNDEIPENTAFFGQQTPDTGEPENGVVTTAGGFIPGGNILSDPDFAAADFTAPDYEIARIRVFKTEEMDEPVDLSAILTGSQEVPQFTGSPATGSSSLTLNETGDGLEYSLTVSGLDFGAVLDTEPQTPETYDDVTRIHIHNGIRGENGPVAFGLFDLVAPEAGGQDSDDLNVVENPDGSVTLSGIWEETDPALIPLSQFAEEIQNAGPGEDIGLYWNIHTEAFPGGEIRGQLRQGTLQEPEPKQILIEVENLAPENGSVVTPFWFGIHDGSFDTFEPGAPAPASVEILAEEGFVGLEGLTPDYPSYEGTAFEGVDLANLPIVPLSISGQFADSFAADNGGIQGIVTAPDDPLAIRVGETASRIVAVQDPAVNRFLSYGAMIFPSNDAFIGDEMPLEIFDEAGNFIGGEFIIAGNQVWDAGTEVNDEIIGNLPFGLEGVQMGVPENGVVALHEGLLPPGSGGVQDLIPPFSNSDFSQPGYQVARIRITEVGGGEPGLPEISIFAEPDEPISELNEEPGTFIFRLSEPAPEGGLVVNFTAGDDDPDPTSMDVNIGGEGTENIDDFDIRPIADFVSTVTIAEGATEARLAVTPFLDGLIEDPETISADLLPGEGYTVAAENTPASLTILDGDAELQGDDNIEGGGGDEILQGGLGDDTVSGGLGSDRIEGNEGDDVLRGDRNSRSPGGSEGGDDTLLGGSGDDRLGGKGGNDELFGGEGDDSLWGDAGDDLLDGGSGDDLMFGGAGSDRFVLTPGYGTDVVADFAVGIDSLILVEGLSFEQLELMPQGGGVAIAFAETDEVLAIVSGVQVDDLSGSFV